MPETGLREWIETRGIRAEQLFFEASCHSVEDAVAATGAPVAQVVKNVCMIGPEGGLIVGVVPGTDRVSTTRVGKALSLSARPRVATPEEVLERTGFAVGGVPSFGYPATVLLDPGVMEQTTVYTGGGSARSLIRLSPGELQRASEARVVRVRK